MKLEINIDSTSLGNSNCMCKMVQTVIGNPEEPEAGGYVSQMNAAAMYGVAGHKFLEVMFKSLCNDNTVPNFPKARVEAERVFNMPKKGDDKKPHLMNHRHLISSCYNLWTTYVEEESSFELIQISQTCPACSGQKFVSAITETTELDASSMPCKVCKGEGTVIGPATEITFRILYYEDDFCKIFLCGTIDSVGKIKGGCYAIRDWKFTSSWHKDWIKQFELSRQLRVYTLACKLMAELHPDSILGKVGATNMGAFIDGIHIKSEPNENTVERSRVWQLSDKLDSFERMLKCYCARLSLAVQNKYYPKEGILNGTCTTPYGRCMFWGACYADGQGEVALLNRDFKRKPYNPLAFNT